MLYVAVTLSLKWYLLFVAIDQSYLDSHLIFKEFLLVVFINILECTARFKLIYQRLTQVYIEILIWTVIKLKSKCKTTF